MVIGSVQAPLYGLAVVLNGLLCGVVYAVSAIQEQKAEAEVTTDE
jgi:hypothetical protein